MLLCLFLIKTYEKYDKYLSHKNPRTLLIKLQKIVLNIVEVLAFRFKKNTKEKRKCKLRKNKFKLLHLTRH